ncbi:CAP-Gly domain-containing protein [Trichophyton interdigitale]|uniref:CAP-Gly domain-containing protein n=1 Tax=Trichophyton interdigitale TaxID=101480 RepID=A0A9P4YJU0_9EURO|nr:CAP-Gly domain-containing protein [Trichophyton interdigitale]KAF3900259.1 CAP-Gly domain-containing protein [Trichophyton interdigitale]KAG8207882.1 CAP-Gly domain-containing protein [Trichophyton interdigitale]
MTAADDVQVGDLVNVPGGMYGTVRFLGPVAGKPGRFAGVELAPELAGRGKNSGDVDGRHYFTTSIPGSGIFVPMNNSKYVTRRAVAPQLAATSARSGPSITNFSRSVGPGLNLSSTARPRIRRPSLPRPDSPSKGAPLPSPKLNVSGLRTPSGLPKGGPPMNGRPRTPLKSRSASRPSSRISMESTTPKRADAVRTPVLEDSDVNDRTRELEMQLRERDKQLEVQAATLAEFQQCVTELEGLDALQVRAQLKEKNDKISALTAEFDSHRADFRSTLDTLEVAASETERVYEKRIEELLQANRELQSRGEDVETVALQLKQLEELVSELEEGLEDARRGEAEARGEVEYLRGEVERTRLELKQERERSSGSHQDGESSAEGSGRHHPTIRDLEQKDDEIRGLKAIIHSLSRGDPTSQAFLQQNGIGQGKGPSDGDYDANEQLSKMDLRIQELEAALEHKTQRISELQQEVEMGQAQTNAFRGHTRSGTITTSPLRVHKNAPQAGSDRAGPSVPTHAHTLSDRTIVPGDWTENSPGQGNTLDAQSSSTDDGSAAWCEICETSGHDILTCTNMFGTMGAASKPTSHPASLQPAAQPPPVTGPPERSSFVQASIDSALHDSIDSSFSSITRKPSSTTPETNGSGSGSASAKQGSPSSQRTGRDVVLEGLKGIGGLPSSSMAPVAGKSSGVIDESKWCALCERDGHESIDCPFDE